MSWSKLFFTPDKEGNIPRSCTKCGTGRLELKLEEFGPFLGCDNYPECRYTKQISSVADNDDDNQELDGDKMLGMDSASNLPVLLRKGPYGFYVQLGDAEEKKPKRASLPKGTVINNVELEYALGCYHRAILARTPKQVIDSGRAWSLWPLFEISG